MTKKIQIIAGVISAIVLSGILGYHLAPSNETIVLQLQLPEEDKREQPSSDPIIDED
jgi:hypothetical protein